MAETKYSIHAGTPKIYVHIPEGKSVTIDDTTKGTVEVTIPEGTYMKATDSFGFNYCAFVQIEVIKSDGTKKVIPNLSEDFISKVTTSGYNVVSTFKEVLADYVFLFRVGEEYNEDWTSYPTLVKNRTKTFTIDSDAESYTIYFCGITVNTATWTNGGANDSDSLRYSNYTWATTERNTDINNTGGGNACPCDEHKAKVDSEALLTKNLVIGPLGVDIRTIMTWDKPANKYIAQTFEDLKLNDEGKPVDGLTLASTANGTPTIAVDHGNNSFSAVIRPFKPGKNNSISRVYGQIEFRKDSIPIGEFCMVPEGKSFRPQVWNRAVLDESMGSYVMASDLAETEYRCIGVYEASTENGKVVYKELITLYNKNDELTSSSSKLYYRRVTKNSIVKQLNFDSHPGRLTRDTHFNIEPWLDDNNKNTASTNKASDLKITEWPLTVAPLAITAYEDGKKADKEVLAGTSAIWIDMFACATEFDPTGLKPVNGAYYISVADYENTSFYEGKNYSPEYFHKGYTFKLSDGKMIQQETLPPYKVPGSVTPTENDPHPSFLADTFETDSGNICSIVKLDATDDYKNTHYYIANRSLMTGDVRKSRWLNTGYFSYPRAPKKLWYESTHSNKTYVSDSDAPLEDNTYVYKKDLRPRLKDTFTWKWDQAYGDIYTPTEPSYYRVILYLKTKELRTDNTKFKALYNRDGYYYYAIDSQSLTGLSSKNLVRTTKTEGNIDNVPCFEMQAKYLTLNLKELGFKSGDYCGCKIYSFINRWGRIYSEVDLTSDFYKNLTKEPGNYEITPSDPFKLTSFNYNNNKNIIENTDKSLYGSKGYVNDYEDISFADGGCPALEGSNGEKIGYDYNESLDDCEVRNGATVWVKVSDEPNDWVEGTPWIKTENGWKEADSLHVKTDNSATGWKESD